MVAFWDGKCCETLNSVYQAHSAGKAVEIFGRDGKALDLMETIQWAKTLRGSAPVDAALAESEYAGDQMTKLNLEAARRALRAGLLSSIFQIALDAKGYTETAEQNLVPGVDLDDFRADFEQGSGNELAGKFRAAHSSSALAANCFGPFVKRPQDLILCDVSGFRAVSFERKCPVGLAQARTPPNLDVVAEASGQIVAVESKCIEYLSPKKPKFADAYRDQITDVRRDGPWYAEMMRLREDPNLHRHLDVAQLIKHAFGLSNTFPDRNVRLLYLFWEPVNADEFGVFRAHRKEIEGFAARVAGGFPSFHWASYPELWADCSTAISDRWIADHVAHLKRRYGVAVA